MSWLCFVMAALPFVLPSQWLFAGDLGCLDITKWFQGTKVDVHRPEACNQCGHETCIERTPVQDCVQGEKKVYKTSIHCEHVAIPEVRYKWEWKWVEKEIPADYCKTVCDTENVDHQYEVEHWQKSDLPCGGEMHCKSCEEKIEKIPCKTCKTEPGKTKVKVHYWSYVKVPYTVYRQVEREVCVKQPRCEKVEVPVTRYVGEHCGGLSGRCERRHCEHCNGKGCKYCKETGYVDYKAEGSENPIPASDVSAPSEEISSRVAQPRM
jgi:hypothetical protein